MKKLLILFIFFFICFPLVKASFGYDKVTTGTTASDVTVITGNLTAFTQLTDTPGSYSGDGSKCVKVNAGETALEFVACAGGGDVTNNTAGWTLNFSAIFSDDWSNVTITESQITDLSHTVDTSAFVNCSSDEVFLGNGSCLSSSLLGGGNSSWNQSHADTLYAGIEWDYNQTTATFNNYNSTWDQSWTEQYAYNHTLDVFSIYNSTWDQTFMIKWNYNQSTATFNMYNETWSSTYNVTYDNALATNHTQDTFNNYNSTWDQQFMIKWNYNQTTATFNNYNSTWDQQFMTKWNYNQSEATFNMWNSTWSIDTDTNESVRFDNLVGNCSADELVFGVNSDGTKVCVPDNTGEGGKGTVGPYLYNTSVNILFNESFLNDTIDDREIDTNASNCADGRYLDGNGECIHEDRCTGNTFSDNGDCIYGQVSIELIILISVLSGGGVIGVLMFLLIRWKKRR